MSSGSNATIVLEVVDRLRKSWWTVVAGLCVGLACSVATLHYLPRTFKASTLIFVAPQSVPQEFVRSTVTDDMSMRLQSLKESVLSRPYLEQLANDYLGHTDDPVKLEMRVNDIRSRVEVDVIGVAMSGSGKTGGTFRLSYYDSDSKRAAAMVNALADSYIAQNLSSRTAQAEGTTKTVEGLAGDVSARLEAQQKLITEFRREHLYEIADQQNSNVSQLQGRQQDLNTNAVALAAAQDRLSSLKAQQSVLSHSPGTALEADPLTKAEGELVNLRNRYTDTHPEVIAKRHEIENLKAQMPATGTTPGDAAVSPLQAGIRSAEREVQRLQADELQIRKDIAEFKRRLEATPKYEAQLQDLMKGYSVLVEQYNRRAGSVEEARGAQKIEETQKGERFEVIERALPPAIPVRPVPMMIYAAGAIGGLVLFVGPLLVLALLEPLISSETGLREAAEVPVLVAIPRLMTDDLARSLRAGLTRNIAASAVSVVILIIASIMYR
ncbi:MAG TPA: hypothetical protein VFV19_11155 [Candidatus Polarisedimenticolaceae bacterium]|nr:hypothetical protein [Candidatus Polarisedimenticolaceae bacterium]